MQFFLMVFVPPMVTGSNVFLVPCRNRRDLFEFQYHKACNTLVATGNFIVGKL